MYGNTKVSKCLGEPAENVRKLLKDKYCLWTELELGSHLGGAASQNEHKIVKNGM